MRAEFDLQSEDRSQHSSVWLEAACGQLNQTPDEDPWAWQHNAVFCPKHQLNYFKFSIIIIIIINYYYFKSFVTTIAANNGTVAIYKIRLKKNHSKKLGCFCTAGLHFHQTHSVWPNGCMSNGQEGEWWISNLNLKQSRHFPGCVRTLLSAATVCVWVLKRRRTHPRDLCFLTCRGFMFTVWDVTKTLTYNCNMLYCVSNEP